MCIARVYLLICLCLTATAVFANESLTDQRSSYSDPDALCDGKDSRFLVAPTGLRLHRWIRSLITEAFRRLVENGEYLIRSKLCFSVTRLPCLIVCVTSSAKAPAKARSQPECNLTLIGEKESDEVLVSVICDQGEPQEETFNYKTHPESAPPTEDFGFRLFYKVRGVLYAIVVNAEAKVVIDSLEVRELNGLGSLFLVCSMILLVLHVLEHCLW